MDTEPNRDKCSLNETLLTTASSAGHIKGPKRWSVFGIMKETFKLTGAFDLAGLPFCSETEIFKRAYGDPEGREYWREWLFHPLAADQLADLIATHNASSKFQLELIKNLIDGQLGLIDLSNTGDAVDWLIDNPDTADFVCDSLKKYRRPFVATDAPPPALVASDKGTKTPKVKKDPGRPLGTGFQKKDAPLCEKMQEMIDSGEVSSVSEAAKKVAHHAEGKTLQAKVKRLCKLFGILKENNCAAITLSTQK